MRFTFFITITSYLLLAPQLFAQQYLGNGSISFVSNAPLETITASSNKLRGVIITKENNFAFTFPVNSFTGFNSPLQKEHFNEYYLESRKFPKATFKGKIIGLKECIESCELEVFAKGKMTIHGVSKIIAVPLKLKVKENEILLKAAFDISLSEYDISIPRILEAKISPVIKVIVTADLITKDE